MISGSEDLPSIERLVVRKGEVSFEPPFFEHVSRYRFSGKHGSLGVVLDAACGSGYGTFFLARRAIKAIGIDCSHEAIASCEASYTRRNLRFLQMDVQATAFKNRTFDTVISFETIEHLTDPEKFVWEMRRILRPHGRLFVSTPVKGVYDQVFLGENPYHLHEMTVDEFTRLLSTQFHIEGLYGQRFKPYMKVSEEKLQSHNRYRRRVLFKIKRLMRMYVFNHSLTYPLFGTSVQRFETTEWSLILLTNLSSWSWPCAPIRSEKKKQCHSRLNESDSFPATLLERMIL